MATASAPTPVAYPVKVEGALDKHLSRWLWLVKWVLAIPHFIVLAFLWMAFAVVSVVAFFAILFTGRYPRGLFDFNVGVLRWTWRVAYYSCGVLGTDRYPPFSLADDPDYPAHLDVPYPERLSRGLVLVKWWLLAIPHYLVLAFFLGGGTWFAFQLDDNGTGWAGGGLVGILVLIAAISLLFRGVYPRSIFDLVLGLNRWSLRVAAYAALMTDAYPPFRLDLGGDEPGSVTTTHTGPPTPPHPATVTPAPTTPPDDGWTAGRIVGAVMGSILVLGSLTMLSVGGTAFVADRALRDDGYVTTGQQDLSATTSVLVTDDVTVDDMGIAGSTLLRSTVGDIRTRVTPVGDTTAVFIGIAPADAVQRLLADSTYTTVTDPVGDPAYTVHRGAQATDKLLASDVWVASARGSGQQSLVWEPAEGSWTLVVIDPTGRQGLAVKADIGAEAPALTTVAVTLIVIGLVTLVGSIVLLTWAVRGANRGATDRGATDEGSAAPPADDERR